MILLIMTMIFMSAALFFYSFFMMIEGRESPADRLQDYIEVETPKNIEEFEKKNVRVG